MISNLRISKIIVDIAIKNHSTFTAVRWQKKDCDTFKRPRSKTSNN